MPLEGFNKDQERKLKSKKRSLVHQSEEDKWKTVYRILFPDDADADMPSPYIEYHAPNTYAPGEQSNIAQFQEFSRLELPRLVRRTLEAAVEQEAQPLEEKLKERLVDIVEECQSQLISMFQSIGGTVNPSEPPNPLPTLNLPYQRSKSPSLTSFHSFDSSHIPNPAPAPETMQYPNIEPRYLMTNPAALESISAEKPSNISTISGSPDSGYDSTWTGATHPRQYPLDATFAAEQEYAGFDGFYGFENRSVEAGFDASIWAFMDAPAFGNGGTV